MKIPSLTTFAMFRGVSNYEELKEAVKDFDRATRSFNSSHANAQDDIRGLLEKQQATDKKLLVRPDAHVQNMESKIDTLAEQLSGLTLLMKKGSTSYSRDPRAGQARMGKEWTCSFFKQAGHGDSQCQRNPNKDKQCTNCGKIGHDTDSCWSTKKLGPGENEHTKNQVSLMAESDADQAHNQRNDKSGGSGVNVLVEDREEEDESHILAIKRGADGEPKPKSARRSDEDPMTIGKLLNPETSENKKLPTPKRVAKKAKKKTKSVRHKRNKNVSETIQREKYDVVSALTNAQSGLTFGQLWKGDATGARKELQRIIGKGKLKMTVVEEVKTKNELNLEEDSDDRYLGVSVIRIHGTKLFALMDSGATPNVFSPQVVKRLSLKPQETSKVVTVATGEKSKATGKLSNVPVMFDELQAEVDFIVLEDTPFDVVISRPTIKRLGGVIDLPAEVVRFDYRGQKAVLPMVPEYSQPRLTTDSTDSEDFTSDSDIADSHPGGTDNEIEALVLMINGTQMTPRSNHTDEKCSTVQKEVIEKLSHLPAREAAEILDALMTSKVVASSLNDLGPVNVPVEHSFQLTDNNPVYHRGRRMAPKHNELVRDELQKMLRAGIVTSATSAWSFSVVIATKKDGKPRFCVDYRVLNQRMKGDRFPLPKIQEIFDELSGGAVFTTLDFFSGYWQIRMSEDCKEKTTFVCRYGTYQFEVMPFGLMNAPSTFQRMMDGLLGHLPFVKFTWMTWSSFHRI